jgi:hypothetical protein
MAGPLTQAYSVVVLLVAVVGMLAVVSVTRETGEADSVRLGLTGAAVLLFLVALVATLVLGA